MAFEIGDWVRVEDWDIIFKITEILPSGPYYTTRGTGAFVETRLQPLTPAQVAALCPEELLRKIPQEETICEAMQKAHEKIHEFFGELDIEERLSAIEKRQKEIDDGLDHHRQSHEKWRDRILQIEERLEPDVVSKILDGDTIQLCEGVEVSKRLYEKLIRDVTRKILEGMR